MSGRGSLLGVVLSVVATGTATLAVSAAPAAGMPLIFNDGLAQSYPGQTNYTTGDLARAASDIAPGAILRFTVPWNVAQAYCLDALGNHVNNRTTCQTPGPISWTPTPYNWGFDLQGQLNSIASFLQSGQVKLLPVVGYAPGWAWGAGEIQDQTATATYDPNHPDMPPGGDSTALGWWQQFNKALVSWLEKTYGQSSVAGVEVWNEEDHWPDTWSTTSSDYLTMSSRYSQVLCSAYAGARQVDSSLPVIFGGFYPLDSYLQSAYTSPLANIRNCMTAIAIHPYNSINLNGCTGSNCATAWAPPSFPNSPFDAGASTVSQTSASNSDAGRAIWITEFGYNVGTPPNLAQCSTDGKTSVNCTEQNKADWDAQAYTLAPSKPNVQAMGIHTIFDQNGGFQICAGPKNPLPAATKLKQTVSGNSTAVATC